MYICDNAVVGCDLELLILLKHRELVTDSIEITTISSGDYVSIVPSHSQQRAMTPPYLLVICRIDFSFQFGFDLVFKYVGYIRLEGVPILPSREIRETGREGKVRGVDR